MSRGKLNNSAGFAVDTWAQQDRCIDRDEQTERGAEIALPASKNVIASRLNLTPETLSRILHALTERGLIDVHGRIIVAQDIERLRNFES